ncbi:hypothetical protein NMY22_g20214 [Coprinellus aureogranulatus]|nr:hypothetical protein NMY22_g20214 [Coprinellus aureogranulatus]
MPEARMEDVWKALCGAQPWHLEMGEGWDERCFYGGLKHVTPPWPLKSVYIGSYGGGEAEWVRPEDGEDEESALARLNPSYPACYNKIESLVLNAPLWYKLFFYPEGRAQNLRSLTPANIVIGGVSNPPESLRSIGLFVLTSIWPAAYVLPLLFLSLFPYPFYLSAPYPPFSHSPYLPFPPTHFLRSPSLPRYPAPYPPIFSLPFPSTLSASHFRLFPTCSPPSHPLFPNSGTRWLTSSPPPYNSAALLYLLIMSYIVLRVLAETRPMWFYLLSALLFVLGQLAWFLLGRVLCTGPTPLSSSIRRFFSSFDSSPVQDQDNTRPALMTPFTNLKGPRHSFQDFIVTLSRFKQLPSIPPHLHSAVLPVVPRVVG